MDLNRAKRLAQRFVGTQAILETCDASLVTLYNFDPAREHLFYVHRPDLLRVGGTEVVAVSKESGAVRSTGFHGE